MYQLGLSPAAAEVPSMSAVALGANRWASRVVVVLQLAAWSAVGIVLLQKGVSSLQKTPVDVKNVTKANYNETAVANLMMKIVFPEKDSDLSSAVGNIRDPEYPAGLEKSRSSIGLEVGDDGAIGRSIPPVIPLGSLTPNHLSDEDDDTKKVSWSREKNSPHQGPKYSKANFQDGEKDPSTESTTTSSWVNPTSTSSEKYVNVFEARKKLKTSNLNGGGGAAAAAVAMVAVGAVMLVLGPIVIVLRALDERRQERRFLKLSGQDDLPPSYEQATLMDEAPRYSTLSLNTISCSPAAAAAAAAAATATGTTGSSTVDSSVEREVQEV